MADQRDDVDRGARRIHRGDIGGHRRWTYLSAPPSRFNDGGTSACTSGARLIRRNLDVELSFGLITTPDGEVAALWRSAATATNAT
jgi:hypothetical protein